MKIKKIASFLRNSIVVVSLCGMAATAMATIIDFEDVAVTHNTHLIVNSFIANDFVLSRDGNGHIDLGNDEVLYTNNGTQVAFVHNGSFTINVDSISEDTFEISQFDGAEFWRDGQANASAITLDGITDLGINVSENFVLDGIFDGRNGVDDFELFTVSNAFQNLVHAEFSGGGAAFSIDNIIGYTASEVPEPSILFLLGIGITFFAAGRRKIRVTD